MTDQASSDDDAPKPTVMLVEDNPQLRSVMRTLIDEDPRIEIVREVATAGQAVAYALANDVGLVIFDHHLDDGESGLDAAEVIREARPATRIVMCTADIDVNQSDRPPAVDAMVSKHHLITLLTTVQTLLGLTPL